MVGKLVQLPGGGFERTVYWVDPRSGRSYSTAQWRDVMRSASPTEKEWMLETLAQQRAAETTPPTPPARPMELWELEQAKKIAEQEKEIKVEEQKIKEAGEISRRRLRVEPQLPSGKKVVLAGFGIPSLFEAGFKAVVPEKEKRREPGVEEVIAAGKIGVRFAEKAYRKEIPSDIVGILPSEKKKGYDIIGEVPFFETKRTETIKDIGKEIIKISQKRIEVKTYENGKLISSTSSKAPEGRVFDVEAIKADARTKGMKVKGSTIEAPIRERLVLEEAIPTEDVSLLIGRAKGAEPFVSKKTKEEIERAWKTKTALHHVGLHAHTLLSPAGKEYIGTALRREPLKPVVKKRLGVLLERGKAGELTFPGLAAESVIYSPATEIATAYWLGTGIAKLGVTKIGARVLTSTAGKVISYGGLGLGIGIKGAEIERLRREERKAEALGTAIVSGASLLAGYRGYKTEYERLHPKKTLEAVGIRREETRVKPHLREMPDEFRIYKEPVKSKWLEAIPRKEITDVAAKGKTVRETADYIIKTYKGTEVLLMKKTTGFKESTADLIDVMRMEGRYAGRFSGMDAYVRQSHYLPISFEKPPAKEFKPLVQAKGKPRSDILQWLTESYKKVQAIEDKNIAEQIAESSLQQIRAIEGATRSMLRVGVKPKAPPGIKTFIGVKAPAPRLKGRVVSETDFIGLQTIQRKKDTMGLLYPTKTKVKHKPRIPELKFKPTKVKLVEKTKARQALIPGMVQREITATDLKEEIKEFQEYMPPTRLRKTTRIREKLKKETMMPSYEEILFPSLDILPPAARIPFLPRLPRPRISGGFLDRGFDFRLPGKQRTAYTPSLIAMEFDIFGEEPKGILTGVEIRPMVRRKKKKGKRKKIWLL